MSLSNEIAKLLEEINSQVIGKNVTTSNYIEPTSTDNIVSAFKQIEGNSTFTDIVISRDIIDQFNKKYPDQITKFNTFNIHILEGLDSVILINKPKLERRITKMRSLNRSNNHG